MPRTVVKHLNAYSKHEAHDLPKKLDQLLLKENLDEYAEFQLRTKANLVSENLAKAGKGCKFIRQQCRIETDEDAHTEEERKHFQVKMDVSNFKDVNVNVVGKYLVVHAKHDFMVDDHGIVSREFTRKFEIPDDVDIEKCRSCVDCYNVLIVQAPLKPKDVGIRKIEILGETDIQPTGWYRQQSIDDLKQGYQEWKKIMDKKTEWS